MLSERSELRRKIETILLPPNGITPPAHEIYSKSRGLRTRGVHSYFSKINRRSPVRVLDSQKQYSNVAVYTDGCPRKTRHARRKNMDKWRVAERAFEDFQKLSAARRGADARYDGAVGRWCSRVPNKNINALAHTSGRTNRNRESQGRHKNIRTRSGSKTHHKTREGRGDIQIAHEGVTRGSPKRAEKTVAEGQIAHEEGKSAQQIEQGNQGESDKLRTRAQQSEHQSDYGKPGDTGK